MFPGTARFQLRHAAAAVLLLAAAVLLAGDTVLFSPLYTPVRQITYVAGDILPGLHETAPQLSNRLRLKKPQPPMPLYRSSSTVSSAPRRSWSAAAAVILFPGGLRSIA